MVVAGMKAQGVLCGTASADEVRFVTHRDVRPEGVRAGCVAVLREVFERVGSMA